MAKRVNLIPMSGAGQRFVDAGYDVPKPLIEVAGKPMIARAANSLPNADEWIFVCREFHITESAIDTKLKDIFPNSKVLSVKELTEGQACTCLLAKDLWDDDEMLTIGACDNAMTYQRDCFEKFVADTNTDAIIWSFRNNPAVLQNPSMYGWVDVDGANNVRSVSCKKPISDDPLNDHAVIGSFTFRRAGDFVVCAEAMINEDIRINNEFYVDVVMDVAVKRGLKVKVFEVDQYICWGTPADLDTYNYWRAYFVNTGFP